MTFYQRLNELKAEKGVSQKEIRNALGMGKNSFGYWRNGVTPNRSTQLLLAEYFGVSVEYLMGETDIKEKPATDEGDELSQEFKSLKHSLYRNLHLQGNHYGGYHSCYHRQGVV